MPSLTLPDRLIWFAHCPKAGGTTLEHLMVETWGDRVGHLHWGWDIWWRRGGWRQANPPNSPQHLTWSDAIPTLPRNPDDVFALVRNPEARMASEHRYQRKFRRGTWLGRALARLPFPVWLRIMLEVRSRNPFAFDNHLRAQTDFVPEHAVVFHLEDGMTAPLAWLRSISGQNLSAPAHLLKTSKNRTSTMGASESALIASVFAEDYARFGYPRPLDPTPKRNALDVVAAALAPAIVWLERRGRL